MPLRIAERSICDAHGKDGAIDGTEYNVEVSGGYTRKDNVDAETGNEWGEECVGAVVPEVV